MNEQLIVLLSEIILGLLAIASIVTVLAASWHDVRLIRDHRLRKPADQHIAPTIHDADDILSIRTMPSIFIHLSAKVINKAYSWRAPEYSERSTSHEKSNIPDGAHQTHITTLIMACFGLIVTIFLLTYFFYTAATLRSDALLTLSWAMISLWLIATIWSDETMATSKKYDLTFAVPFMYFVFYVLAFLQLAVTLWQLLIRMKPSKVQWRKISDAIQLELYSTRY